MKLEYAVIIDEKGNIYVYEGIKTDLDITTRKLDNIVKRNRCHLQRNVYKRLTISF